MMPPFAAAMEENGGGGGGGGSCRADAYDDGRTRRAAGAGSTTHRPPPESCGLFLAPRRRIDDDDDKVVDEGATRRWGRRLGVYAGVDIPRGAPLTPLGGDVLVHLIDAEQPPLLPPYSSSFARWVERGYLVDASTSGLGGNYEGLGTTLTAASGIGSLSSSAGGGWGGGRGRGSGRRPNAWAPVGEVDEAGLSRRESPLAGSFSLYHNLTYFATSKGGIKAGGEVLVDRHGWFRDEAARLRRREQGVKEEEEESEEAGMSWNDDIGGASSSSSSSSSSLDNRLRTIREEGVCMDNLHYGESPHGYGRGAIASRFLPGGSVVSPVPVLPVPRSEMRYLRSEERKRAERWRHGRRRVNDESTRTTTTTGGDEVEDDDDAELPPGMRWREQLLLNYCLGHVNSSVLLFPYGHANYVNQAPSSSTNGGDGGGGPPLANVGLRWSEKLMRTDYEEGEGVSDPDDPRSLAPAPLMGRPDPDGLVLEMFALRDIRPSEEVLLDYGDAWRAAWGDHVRHHPEHEMERLRPEIAPSTGRDLLLKNLTRTARFGTERLLHDVKEKMFRSR